MPAEAENLRPLCPQCGSPRVQSRGRGQYQCQEKKCGKWFTPMPALAGGAVFGNHAEINAFVPRIMSDRDLLEYLQVDMNYWRVEKVIYGKTDSYRKDRSVEWDVEGGRVEHGEVHDSGKILIVPLFSVKVVLKRKVEEIAVRDVFGELLEDLRRHAPKFPKINYPRQPRGCRFELCLTDVHLGLLAWGEESGVDYDLHITVDAVNRVVDELLSHTVGRRISRIILPVGNDFFNVNNQDNTTVHGTPQSEDSRWQKTFRVGYELMVNVINRCMQIAPVDVIMVPGNHDEERSFYLGEVIKAYYHNTPAVTVDNRAKPRKYYGFGQCMIGFTHGYYEKLEKLAGLMAAEEPKMWAASKFREFHTGDKHHKKDMLTTFSDEGGLGVVVRILRALSAPSAWADRKGFIGAQRAAEAFLWDPDRGLVAQFTACGD